MNVTNFSEPLNGKYLVFEFFVKLIWLICSKILTNTYSIEQFKIVDTVHVPSIPRAWYSIVAIAYQVF